MKKILCIVVFPILFALLGCESRHETVGTIAGMWQMQQWTVSDGTSQKNDSIYYSFQLELMKVQKLEAGGYMGENFFLMHYTHKGDSLIISEIYARPNDKIVSPNSLQYLGVPKEGRYHIDHLSSDGMILSSSLGTLIFRKY